MINVITTIRLRGAEQPLVAEVAGLAQGLRSQVGLREELERHERRGWETLEGGMRCGLHSFIRWQLGFEEQISRPIFTSGNRNSSQNGVANIRATPFPLVNCSPPPLLADIHQAQSSCTC